MKKSNKLIKMTVTARICLLLTLASLLFTPARAETQVIKLKYGSYAPHAVYDDVTLWFIEEVSKRSGLKIEIETYFSGILAKAPDCLDALGKGVYDIGWVSPAFISAKLRLAVITNATPLVAPSVEVACKAADEVVRTLPAAAAEYERANVNYLFHWATPHFDLISTKPVKSLGDIKGLRIRTYGYLSKAWADLGGVPVTIPIPEIYDALQKGTIDGALSQPDSMYNVLRLYEVAKNFTKMNLGCVVGPVLINKGSWNKLPEKVRKEMLNLSRDMPAIADRMVEKSQSKAIEGMRKEGVSMYDLQGADKARIKVEAKIIAEYIVNDLAAKGVANAKEVMNIYLAAIEKYGK